MKYTNIANILNSQIVANSLGIETTIAEDLANIVEVGKKVADMTSDDLKSFQKALVLGVYNYVVSREYESNNFEMLKDAVAYGGGLQRIMATGLFSAQDSHLLNLINGESYLDGKYYGMDVDAKFYQDTKAFKVVHSISDDTFSQMFMNAEDTFKFMGLLEVTESNTVRVELAQLEKRVIVMLASNAYSGNRVVHLLTAFNEKLGSAYTYAQICSDRKLVSYFADFCKECVNRIKSAMLEINKKYNDGTVVTFSRKSDVHTVLISEFAQDIKYLGNPIDINAPDISEYKEIVAWQNPSADLLPNFEKATSIVYKNGEESQTINNVIGMVYDVESAGVTLKADKITVEYVGTEGFRNIHHHLALNYYVDSRLGSVIFALD